MHLAMAMAILVWEKNYQIWFCDFLSRQTLVLLVTLHRLFACFLGGMSEFFQVKFIAVKMEALIGRVCGYDTKD